MHLRVFKLALAKYLSLVMMPEFSQVLYCLHQAEMAGFISECPAVNLLGKS